MTKPDITSGNSSDEESVDTSDAKTCTDTVDDDNTVTKTVELCLGDDSRLPMKKDATVTSGIPYDANNNMTGAVGGDSEQEQSEDCSSIQDTDVSTNSTETRTQSVEELHIQLKKILFEHLHEIPGVIKRCRQSPDSAKLQIQIAKGKSEKAQQFLSDHLGHYQNIELIEDNARNTFMHGTYFLANPHMRPEECTYQIGRGSAVIALHLVEAEKLDYSKDIRQVGKPYGTLTCIMRDEASKEYYGLAPGHVLLDQPSGDHEWPPEAYHKVVISDYKQSDSTERWTVTKLANSCFAGMEYMTLQDGTKQFIDVGIFQIDDSLIGSEQIRLALGNDYHGSNTMYERDDKELMGQKVVKLGAETGRSFGEVTGVNETLIVEVAEDKEVILTGGITILADNEKRSAEFGRGGDSGGPVFLAEESNTIVAYICAGSSNDVVKSDGTTVRVYKEIYCIRMDSAIKYIQMKTHLNLQFPQFQDPSNGKAQANVHHSDERVLTYKKPSSKSIGRTQGPSSATAETNDVPHSNERDALELTCKKPSSDSTGGAVLTEVNISEEPNTLEPDVLPLEQSLTPIADLQKRKASLTNDTTDSTEHSVNPDIKVTEDTISEKSNTFEPDAFLLEQKQTPIAELPRRVTFSGLKENREPVIVDMCTPKDKMRWSNKSNRRIKVAKLRKRHKTF